MFQMMGKEINAILGAQTVFILTHDSLFQVLGHKEGLNVMERADPLFLLIGLPTIPVMLILGKMVRWEDYLLKLWRKHSSKLPLLHYLFPDANTRKYTCI